MDDDELPRRASQYSRPPAPVFAFADAPLADLARAMERAGEEALPPTRPDQPVTSEAATSLFVDDALPTKRYEAAELPQGSPALATERLAGEVYARDEVYDHEPSDDDDEAHDDDYAYDDEAHDEEEEEEAYDDETYGDDEAYDDADDDADDDEAHEDGRHPSLVDDAEAHDPNATTLVSARGPRVSSPPASTVAVVEAEDDPQSESLLEAASGGFIGEEAEPPISEPSSADRFGGRRLRREEASLMPVVDDLPAESGPLVVAPIVTARQARLRKVVGIFVGAIAVAALGLGIKAAVDSGPGDAPTATAAPQTPAALADTPAAPAAEASTEASAEASKVKPASIETPEAGESAAPEPASVQEAQKMAIELLREGKAVEAEGWARKVIELDPDDALGYRALGAALQDQGKLLAAKKAFSDCVTFAKTGDVGECTALGGIKQR